MNREKRRIPESRILCIQIHMMIIINCTLNEHKWINEWMNDTIIQLPQCAHPVSYKAIWYVVRADERERKRMRSSERQFEWLTEISVNFALLILDNWMKWIKRTLKKNEHIRFYRVCLVLCSVQFISFFLFLFSIGMFILKTVCVAHKIFAFL